VPTEEEGPRVFRRVIRTIEGEDLPPNSERHKGRKPAKLCIDKPQRKRGRAKIDGNRSRSNKATRLGEGFPIKTVIYPLPRGAGGGKYQAGQIVMKKITKFHLQKEEAKSPETNWWGGEKR